METILHSALAFVIIYGISVTYWLVKILSANDNKQVSHPISDSDSKIGGYKSNVMKPMTAFVLYIQNNLHLFWLSIEEEYDTNKAWQATRRYAQVLDTKLGAWMFVACNADGEPLKTPQVGRGKEYDTNDGSIASIVWHEQWHKDLEEYRQADARCWFVGGDIKRGTINEIGYNGDKIASNEEGSGDGWMFAHLGDTDLVTVEDLIDAGFGLEMSQTLMDKIESLI